jgi:transmembrane sensor
MHANQVEYLVQLYFSGKLSPTQKNMLAVLVIQSEKDEALRIALEKAWNSHSAVSSLPEISSNIILNSIFSSNNTVTPAKVISIANKKTVLHKILIKRFATAAVACAVVIFGILFLYRLNHTQNDNVVAKNIKVNIAGDIKPAANKATLTLADGSIITLDSASTGLLAKQGNTKIIKTAEGQINYKENSKEATALMFNTLSTPRGGQYQLTLSDGSKVWMNAGSSLRFPIVFTGNERRVEITGEIYFEVAKNTAKPFLVSINKNQYVEVLGTHFNVSAYNDDELVKTTLLEGSVKITNGLKVQLLKPGQQYQANDLGINKFIEHADIDEAMAWKNGNFQFSETSFANILKQASRWYDVDFEFENNLIPQDKFSGRVSRSVNLSRLLKWMEWSGIKFKIQGKKIIVLSQH